MPRGGSGRPAATVIGTLLRNTFFGWSFGQIRWAPHTMIGTMGTCAASAMRAAPVLNSRSSKLRLMVASGCMPISSPSRMRCTATSNASCPDLRSTGISRACLMT